MVCADRRDLNDLLYDANIDINFINNNPISINPTTSILDAMKIMEDRQSQISVLPVIETTRLYS